MLSVVSCVRRGFRFEFCLGDIPDGYRSNFFGPLVHPDFPKWCGLEEDFTNYLANIRDNEV